MDVNSLHRERIRNAIQQCERILGTGFHDCPLRREIVIEADLNGVAESSEGLVHRFDPLCKEAVQAFPGFIDRTGRQQMRESLEFRLEFTLFSPIEDLARLDPDIKDIDNLPRGTRYGAPRERVDVSSLYVQTEGR